MGHLVAQVTFVPILSHMVQIQIWLMISIQHFLLIILRDYTQDLDAVLISKPQRMTPDMLSIYQDHVTRAIMKQVSGESKQGGIDVDEAEAFGSPKHTTNTYMNLCL